MELRPLWAAALAVLGVTGCTGSIADAPRPGATPGARPPTGSGSALCTGPRGGLAPLRRLTRDEYDRTVRDLLRDPSLAPARDFVSDGAIGPFRSNVSSPATTSIAREYMAASEALATIAVGKLGELVPCAAAPTDEDACARDVVTTFGRRAYRRTLAAPEVDALVAVYRAARVDRGHDFASAMGLVVQALLQSPHFLYHVELGDQAHRNGDVVPLTGAEVASRLSYFFWGTMPDDALLDAADGGALESDAGIESQARRLLDDPRARDGLMSFFHQWLGLEKLSTIEKNADAFPEFDDALRADMLAETEMFIEHVVWDGDATVRSLLTSRFTFLNERLATLYGVEGVTGAELRRADGLDPSERSGLLTHASLLAINAHSDQTSPVHRGKFVRELLLCQTMPSPPPDVVVTAPAAVPGVTTRERYRQHAEDPYCAGCHTLMDPIGLGFEHYDALGRWRDTEQGLAVDATGEIVASEDVDGVFDGAPALAERLASSRQVQACVAMQTLRFAIGREPDERDECTVTDLENRLVESGGDLRELFLAVAASAAFRHRIVEETEACP